MLDWLVNAFNSLCSVVMSVLQLLGSLAKSIFDLVMLLPSIVSLLVDSIGFLPSVVSLFAVLSISVSVIYLIAGRNTN